MTKGLGRVMKSEGCQRVRVQARGGKGNSEGSKPQRDRRVYVQERDTFKDFILAPILLNVSLCVHLKSDVHGTGGKGLRVT